MKKDRKNLFEFYYLAELTLQKIKPLSRCEELLDEKRLNWLKRKGFFTEIIPRKTIFSKTVYETVFSTSMRYVDFYKSKFYNSHLMKTAANQKLEGFLFGYPSCCVNQFIEHPYLHNSIRRNQQEKLFHWACRDCRVTPELIPYYDKLYNNTEDWFNYYFPAQHNNVFENYQKKIQTAAAAMLISAGITYAQTESDTTHYIPLPDDKNLIGLTFTEEIFLGAYDHGLADTCYPYANFYKSIIDSLPDTVQTNKVYREDNLMWGLVMCPKCGMYINMGYVKIVNPLRELELDIPYLALHFLEYGHFSYSYVEDTSFSRIDIDMLKKILFPFDVEHMLPVTGDTDGDGLTDAEEDSLSNNATSSIKDFDNDGVPDGAQLAEELIRLFPKLTETAANIHSHVKFVPLRGLESCQICGSVHNMGYVEITNPENNRKLQIPYIALHYLAHGSFAYNGTEHQNERVDAVALTRTMKTHTVFTSDDSDNDGLKNIEEVYFNLDTNKVDSDNNGVTDAKELALKFVDSIKALPTEPRTNGPYIEYLGMDGIHLCSVCGKEVAMGIIKIYNPLINTIEPFEISNYAFHFLENGSFEHEGLADWQGNNRIDPIMLSNYLNITTGTEDETKGNIPYEFSLSQNYPNPFNPETKLSFVIGHSSLVSLKVYDVLGNEVATLLNEHKTAGKYKIQFDVKDLPSGIYFYRLVSGKYIQTKKMILIK
jgi:hypothetical protein